MAVMVLAFISWLFVVAASQGSDDVTNVFGFCSPVPVPYAPLCKGPAVEVIGHMWVTESGHVLLPPHHVEMRSTLVPGNDTLACYLGTPDKDADPSCYTQCTEAGVCQSGSGCHCSLFSHKSQYYDTETGEMVTLKNVTLMVPLPQTPEQLHPAAPVMFFHDGKLEYSCPDSCTITCRQKMVTEVVTVPAERGSISLSAKLYLHGGNTNCTLSSRSGMAKVHFVLDHLDGCDFAQEHCATCWSTLGNWDCYTPIEQGVIITVAVVFGIMFLLLLPRLIRAVYRLLRLMTMPIWGPVYFMHRFRYSRAANNIGQSFSKIGRTYSYYMSPSEQEAQTTGADDDEEEEEEGLQRNAWSPKTAPSSRVTAQPGETVYGAGGNRYVIRNQMIVPIYVVAAFCLLATSGTVQACENNGVIPSIVPTCVQSSPGVTNCTASYELRANIAKVGSITCLDIRDAEGFEIGSMEVKLVSVQQFVELESRYFTTDYTVSGQCVSICRYNGHPECLNHVSTLCRTFNYTADPSVNKHINQEFLNYPGQTTCQIGCTGCAGVCGCGLCGPHCRYCRHVVKPKGDPYEVLRPATTSLEATLSVRVSMNGHDPVTSTFTSSGGKVAVGDFDFDMQGALEQITTPIFSSYVVRNLGTGLSYYAPATLDPTMVVGTIGEIQGRTSTSVSSMCTETNCFNYAPQLTTTTNNGLDVNTFTSAISLLNGYPKFPASISGQNYSLVHNSLVAHIDNIYNFDIRVSTPRPVSYTRKVQLVCPLATFVKAAGCWSCQPGATVTIEAHSSCFAGIVSLSTSGDDDNVKLVTTSLLLSKDSAEYTVHFTTGIQNNDFVLILTSDTAHKISVPVTFVAVDFSLLQNMTIGTGNADIGDTVHGSISDFFNSLNPFSLDFNLGLGAAIYTVIAVIVAIVVLVLVLKCCPCCRAVKAARAAKKLV